MKRFIVTSLFIFSTFSASAGFDRTQFKLGQTARYTPMVISYKYKNTAKTPALLTMLKASSAGNVCKVSNYPIKINPGASGSVIVNCSFNDLGYNNKVVAEVQVFTGKSSLNHSLSVQAQVIESGTCEEMDLNHSETLSKMPVLDQDGMGICYAFASSQLIEFHLRQKGYRKNLSAIDASFLHKADENPSEFALNSGYLSETIKSILDEGVASRECINKVIKKQTQGTPLTSEEFLSLVEKVYQGRRKEETDKKIKQDLKSRCDAYGISITQLEKLMKGLTKPFKKYVTDLFGECEKERSDYGILRNLEYSEKMFGTDKSMGIYLNKILDQRIPAAANICAEILQGKPDHRGLDGTMMRIMKDNPKKGGDYDCGAHSVLITAKRKVKNKCEYLVRNSWGGSWNPKSLNCACKTKAGYFPDCKKAPAKSVNKVMVGCWVPAESLLPNTSRFGSFSK